MSSTRVGATWSLHLPGDRSFELTPKAPLRVAQVCLKPNAEASSPDRTCLAYRLANSQAKPTVISALTRGVYERDLLELELSQGVTYILYVCGLSELHVLGRYCDQVGAVTKTPEASRATQAQDNGSLGAAPAKEKKRKRVDPVGEPHANGSTLEAAPVQTHDRPAFVSKPGPSVGHTSVQEPIATSSRSFPPSGVVNTSSRAPSNHSFSSSFGPGISLGQTLASTPSSFSVRQWGPPVLSAATGHIARVGHYSGLFGNSGNELPDKSSEGEGSFFFRS
ncbi:hypothetical protein MD484_g8868, partial [Candolleomyces efflorescens]